MALLDDNSLIDLSQDIPNGRKLLDPISKDEITKFDNYKLEQLQKNICETKKTKMKSILEIMLKFHIF